MLSAKWLNNYFRERPALNALLDTPLPGTTSLQTFADWWEDVTLGMYRVLRERGQLPWQS